MRGRRWAALGLVALAIPALAVPILADTTTGTGSSSKIEAILADLDGNGDLAAVHSTGLLRVYADGSFSVDDGGNTVSGTANGSKDFPFNRELSLENGLVKTPNGLRALPVTVNTTYKLDGNPIAPDQLAGKSGQVEITYTLTNRSLHTQDINYTDSATGKQTTVTGVTAIPITVALTGLDLADGKFDSIQTNGVQGRTADGTATSVSWSGFLAPPLYPGTQSLSVKARTNGFKLSAPQIAMQVGGGDQPASAVKNAQDKGGATAQSLRGYVDQFGAGFSAVKTGVDGELNGLNNVNFDAAKYSDDSSVPINQPGGANFPGVLEALHIFDSGIGTVKTALNQIRTGLSTGDLSNPGASEALKLLEAGLGTGAGQEWDCSIPRDGVPDANVPASPLVGAFAGKPCDVVAASAGFATPGTVLAIMETYKGVFGALIAGLTSVNGGLAQLKTGLGDPAHPKFNTSTVNNEQVAAPADLASALTAIRGGIGTGKEFDCSVPRDGISDATIPGTSTPCDVTAALIGKASPGGAMASLELFKGALAALLDGSSKSKAGLTQISGGISQAIGGLGDPAHPKYLQVPGTTDPRALTPADLASGLKALRDGSGTGAEFDCSLPRDGIADAGCTMAQALAGKAAPVSALATLETFKALLATADSSTLITLINGALAAAVPPEPQLTPVQAGTLLAVLGKFTDPVVNGIGGQASFDCPPYNQQAIPNVAYVADAAPCSIATPGAKPVSLESGLAQSVAGIGTGAEFAGTTPLSFQAIITAVGSGLGLANGGLGQVIAGFGDETNPASIIGGLSALAAGVGAQGNFDCPPYAHLPTALHATDPASGCTVATPGAAATSLEAGLAQISAGIGTGTEFNGSTPLTVQAIINAVNGGIDQIAAGVGSSSAPGTVINALTSLGAGLGNQQSFDCPPYTPQPVGSATAPFGSPTTPDPYQKGKCDESTTGTKPGSAESAIAQIKSVLATIDTGVGAIVSGIGDLDKNGNAVKAVTAPRRSQFGTLVQDPASLQYGLSLIHDGFNGVFTGFGSRSVKAATVLGGLQQISDGLVTGINGAATVSGVVKTGVVSSDQYAAFQNAGAKRATNYPPFVSAPPNASNTTMFLYRLPAIG